MRSHERPIKALGEIALRVTDLDSMQRFHEDIVGLELMRRSENAVFFKIADGYGGHTQVLALFDRSSSPGTNPSCEGGHLPERVCQGRGIGLDCSMRWSDGETFEPIEGADQRC